LTLLAAAAASLLPAPALAAPPKLMNKTITVSYSTSIPAQGSDGATRTANRSSIRIIYISSAGRIFTRLTRRDSGLTASTDTAPGDARANFHFEGGKLVGVMQFLTGAAQMTISFDGGGQRLQCEPHLGPRKRKFPLQGSQRRHLHGERTRDIFRSELFDRVG
jgi:hypothetical protein